MEREVVGRKRKVIHHNSDVNSRLAESEEDAKLNYIKFVIKGSGLLWK